MSKYNTISEFLYDSCEALRNKLGTSGVIKHSDIPSKIQNIYKNPNPKFVNAAKNYENSSLFLADVENYLTENRYAVYNCDSMFLSTKDLTEFPGFNKPMISSNNQYMFSGCSNLTSVNLNNLITSPSISMRGMFNKCSQLETINVSKLDTRNVTNMQSMFNGCSQLKNIDISTWDTSKLQYTVWMFADCTSLTSAEDIIKYIDFSNLWSTEFCAYMFQNCSSLKSIVMPTIKHNSNKRAVMYQMFSKCKNLEYVDISALDFNKISNISGMFLDCDKITSIDFLYDCNFQITGEEKLPIYISSLVSGSKGITTIDFNLSNLNINNVSTFDIGGMFGDCKNLVSAKMFGSLENSVEEYSLGGMFAGCSSLNTVDISNLNTSNCIDMSYMFNNCTNLSTIGGISNLDGSKLTKTNNMFSGMTNLREIDLSNLNAKNVKNCTKMFANCENLVSVNLSNFSLGADGGRYVFEDFLNNYIFYNCPSLKYLNLSNTSFDYNLDNSSYFYIRNTLLPGLKSLNISNIKEIKPTSVCSLVTHNTLEEIDISDIDFSNAIGARTATGLFYNCPNLMSVKIKNLSMKAYSRQTSPFRVIKLFEEDCYQNVMVDFQNSTFCPDLTHTYTLDLTGVWRGSDEEKIACFEYFANSLGVNDTTRTRTIKIYSELYNILTEEQKAIIANKKYSLTSGG